MNGFVSTLSYDLWGHAQKCVGRHCEVEHKTVDELHKVSTRCLDNNQIKPEGVDIGRLVIELLSDCIEMLVFGKNWKTRSTSDSKLLDQISHKVEPRMRSSTSTSHQQRSSHNQLQTALSRLKSSNRLHTWIIPRRRFRRKLNWFKIYFRWCSVYFGIAYDCFDFMGL